MVELPDTTEGVCIDSHIDIVQAYRCDDRQKTKVELTRWDFRVRVIITTPLFLGKPLKMSCVPWLRAQISGLTFTLCISS